MNVMSIMDKPYLSIRECALILGCSERKIQLTIKDEKLKAFKDGMLIRIANEDFKTYLKENTK